MGRRLVYVAVSSLVVLGLLVGLYVSTSLRCGSTASQLDNGEIYCDTVFSAKNSPYRLTHDVVVLPKVTLTIEPGVTILFESGYSLIVSGSLTAAGTAEDKVTFGSSDPASGVWGSVKFMGNSAESFILKYAEITNATQGITINNEYGNALIENCDIHHNQEAGIEFTCLGNIEISNSTIAHNKNGIVELGYLYSETQEPWPYYASLSNIRLQANNIHSNAISGVQLQSIGTKVSGSLSDVLFLSNVISENGGDGIQAIATAGMDGAISNVNFTSNTITNNGAHGVELTATSEFGNGLLANINFSGNNVSSNNGSAIRLESASLLYNVSFSSNFVSGNGEAGVNLQASQHDETIAYDATLFNNTFSNNSQEAIRIEGNMTTNITSNNIIQNNYGIAYHKTQNNIATSNNIANNTQGIFVFEGATVQAQLNYWGDPTGPYQSILNPQGKGNSVNGNGDDIVFIPFLSNSLNTG